LKKIIYSPGEPSGIGPDLIIQIACSKSWENLKIPILSVGDPTLFLKRSKLLRKKLKVIDIKSVDNLSKNKKGVLQVIKISNCSNTNAGKLIKSNAQYVLDNLHFGIQEAMRCKSTALVTGPISKENVIAVNKKFTGHTEYIQKITKSDDVLMMLASDKLKVALATTHIPIKSVSKQINKELIINKVNILNKDLMKKFNLKKPNIKILGLNPHAGENGKIGQEELNHINPAVKILKKRNINVSYPISADTAFSQKMLKETDAYLGMYHDQVLPVLKTLSFGKSINITLGVPIVRTSVDHGVALDMAGSNKSDVSSLELAIKTAKKLIK
jgi:4-hydroxythreonine-4-phosphate dehydrogenase